MSRPLTRFPGNDGYWEVAFPAGNTRQLEFATDVAQRCAYAPSPAGSAQSMCLRVLAMLIVAAVLVLLLGGGAHPGGPNRSFLSGLFAKTASASTTDDALKIEVPSCVKNLTPSGSALDKAARTVEVTEALAPGKKRHIMVYHPGCGHCHAAMPRFFEKAETLAGDTETCLINFTLVNWPLQVGTGPPMQPPYFPFFAAMLPDGTMQEITRAEAL